MAGRRASCGESALLSLPVVLFGKCINSLRKAKESVIRVVFGASSIRLIGQIMWESLIIYIFSAFFALFIAALAVEVAASMMESTRHTNPIYWWGFKIDSEAMSELGLSYKSR